MSANRRGFKTDIEKFACLLNFHQDMTTYFSSFVEDIAFGASHDTYSQCWTGSSQASPEYSAENMQKAVRWALASAHQETEASLTTFVLPFNENSKTSHQQSGAPPDTQDCAFFRGQDQPPKPNSLEHCKSGLGPIKEGDALVCGRQQTRPHELS